MAVSKGKIRERVSDSNWFVYVLLLEEGKYYVGVAVDVRKRYKAHLGGAKDAASFTKQYKPLEILEIVDTNTLKLIDAIKVEDRVVVRYMDRFGSRNVRGGRFLGSDKQVFIKYVNSR